MQIVASLSLCQLICRDNYKYEVTSPNGTQGSHEQLQLEVQSSKISCWCKSCAYKQKVTDIWGRNLQKIFCGRIWQLIIEDPKGPFAQYQLSAAKEEALRWKFCQSRQVTHINLFVVFSGVFESGYVQFETKIYIEIYKDSLTNWRQLNFIQCCRFFLIAMPFLFIVFNVIYWLR